MKLVKGEARPTPADLCIDPCDECGAPVEEIEEVHGSSVYLDFRCTYCGTDTPYIDTDPEKRP